MMSNIVCGRLLGSAEFGQLGVVMATTNLFTSLFASGLSMTATRYVAGYRDSDPNRAGRVIGLSTVTSLMVGSAVGLLICLMAPWMSRNVLNAVGLSTPLMLGAAAMFFAAVNGSQTGALSGFEAFDRIALGNLIRGGSIALLVTIGAATCGLAGALAGYIGAGAVVALFYQLVVRRESRKRSILISYRFSRDDLAILWRFTFPILLSTFMFAPAAWWSNVLLARDRGYAEAGIFSAISSWQMFILFFSNAISNIGLPMLSNVREEKNSTKYRRCLSINFLLILAPAIVVAVPVVIFSRSILHLYGPSFDHGTNALRLIALAAVLSAITIPVGHVLWSLDAMISATLFALMNGAILLIAAYALSGKGASGLAGAYVIMGLIQAAASLPFTFWLLRKRLAPVPSTSEVVLA